MSDTTRGSRAGSQVGPYHLTRLLGVGGMGEVYEAHDTVRQRVVALKLLSPALSHDPGFRERLQWEAQTAGRLHNQHVVPIHDFGEIDGQLFMDMRLIDGTDLSKIVQQSGALNPARAVVIIRQVALALDAAHAVGVIHRDVKPENILVTRDDFVYLVDFGIAEAAKADGATQVGDAAATFRYAAPERFTGAATGHRVDIYSLACVLFECLTGAPPYHGDHSGMLIAAHLMHPIPHPSQLANGVPPDFDAVIERGMAKDPEQRYASAGELALAAYYALSWPESESLSDSADPTQIVAAATEHMAAPVPVGFDQTQVTAQPPTEHMAAPVPVGFDQTQIAAQPSTEHMAAPVGFDQTQMAAQPPATGWPTAPPAEPVGAGWHAGPPAEPVGAGWPSEYGGFPMPHAARQKSKLPLVLAAVAVVVIGGLLAWLLYPSDSESSASDSSGPTSTSPAPSPPDTAAQARLMSLLPVGYATGVCNPTALPKDALAKVSCGQNADVDGPPSATFTLFPDTAALHFAFNATVHDSSVVECPGRIQSPGPWHRNATPDQTSGMLLCASQKSNPIVAWTSDAAGLLAVVQSRPAGPTLDRLYIWWGSHS